MQRQPIVVEVRRNGIVEATHRVHAVAVSDGAVVAEAGDSALTCYMRSSSKPIQALPLARARGDLDERDLAIASASHRATEDQVAAVEALLAKAPAGEDDLELGPQAGRPPQKRFHNCSGKHAGMLALCRAQGWPLQGYAQPDHPVQRACLDVHAEAAEVAAAEIPKAIDGCGVLTFALPLERMAHAYSRFETLPVAAAISTAMRARPELVGGPDGLDYELMRAAPGWFAKGGAEGLLCAASADGLGVVLKAEDGANRPLGPALAAFLALFGVALPHDEAEPLTSRRRELVGEIRVRSS
jgi:L-asparaginase II